jgi:hypothetical protein
LFVNRLDVVSFWQKMFNWGTKKEAQVASVDEYSTQGAYGLKKCHDAEDAVSE